MDFLLLLLHLGDKSEKVRHFDIYFIPGMPDFATAACWDVLKVHKKRFTPSVSYEMAYWLTRRGLGTKLQAPVIKTKPNGVNIKMTFPFRTWSR